MNTHRETLDVKWPERLAPVPPNWPERPAPAFAGVASDSIAPNWDTLKIKDGDCLPHWVCGNAIYHVSFRLADAVPQSVTDDWARERRAMVLAVGQLGRDFSDAELARLQALHSKKVEGYLDSGHGACLLDRPEIAETVVKALAHFNDNRYRLHAWSVMPNHVHVIVEPLGGYDLDRIVQSWKSFTAKAANKILGRDGQFWQHESYDHIIRSEREYRFQIEYVWFNPDKAGVKALRWKTPERDAPATSAEPERDAPATSGNPL